MIPRLSRHRISAVDELGNLLTMFESIVLAKVLCGFRFVAHISSPNLRVLNLRASCGFRVAVASQASGLHRQRVRGMPFTCSIRDGFRVGTASSASDLRHL